MLEKKLLDNHIFGTLIDHVYIKKKLRKEFLPMQLLKTFNIQDAVKCSCKKNAIDLIILVYLAMQPTWPNKGIGKTTRVSSVIHSRRDMADVEIIQKLFSKVY